MGKQTIGVIIPAAGVGQRMQSAVAKQFIEVEGQTILSHTVGQWQQWARDYQHRMVMMIALSNDASLPDDVRKDECLYTCTGGQTRADSVANALAKLTEKASFDWVMVHDAARPLVRPAEIETLWQTLKNDDVGGILALRISETVKFAPAGQIQQTLPREDLYLAQTPQLFRRKYLEQALSISPDNLTDEASALEALGFTPQIIEGHRDNIKITTPQDLDYFKQQLRGKQCE